MTHIKIVLLPGVLVAFPVCGLMFSLLLDRLGISVRKQSNLNTYVPIGKTFAVRDDERCTSEYVATKISLK
jgi:hypothetical protein